MGHSWLTTDHAAKRAGPAIRHHPTRSILNTEAPASAALVRKPERNEWPALMTRLGGLAVVLAGIIIAVLHYWPPHP
jgi:hypothetical protein